MGIYPYINLINKIMRKFLRRKNNGTKACKCPKCGYEMQSQRGIPCTQIKCPKCGAEMRGEMCL